MVDLRKRRFLKQGLHGLSVCGVGGIWANVLLSGCTGQQVQPSLKAADANGVRLPEGFSSRIIASSSEPVVSSRPYLWHAAPDGGACFARSDGGWIYVSNSEIHKTGGAGAIVFNADGDIIDAYAILENTSRNCAGGATPWGSWLSCEEITTGRVWECDPAGVSKAVVRPALGVFNHEAVAVDEINQLLYLTEDEDDGCLYRFRADQLSAQAYPDLSAGTLEVAVSSNTASAKSRSTAAGRLELDWRAVPDPLATSTATRYQVPEAVKFNGGEGIAYYQGQIIFTTKGDNRVWRYQTASRALDILYDAEESLTPILTGVDNITVSGNGDIYVAEDGGDLQIVVLDQAGTLYPVAQLEGHENSEVTGVAFSPDGRRLYFSSQRGTSGKSENGITYEIQGFKTY